MTVTTILPEALEDRTGDYSTGGVIVRTPVTANHLPHHGGLESLYPGEVFQGKPLHEQDCPQMLNFPCLFLAGHINFLSEEFPLRDIIQNFPHRSSGNFCGHPPMETPGKRLAYARGTLRLTQDAFGERIRMNQHQIQYYEIRAHKIPPKLLSALEMAYGINPEWLETGTGRMFLEGKKEGENVPQRSLSLKNLPKEHIKAWLDDFWEKASDRDKVGLEATIERLFPEYRDWLQKNSQQGTEGPLSASRSS